MATEYAEGADAHEAFHDVLDLVEELAEITNRPIATIHQLNGSAETWSRAVIHFGFLACVTGSHGPHHGATLT